MKSVHLESHPNDLMATLSLLSDKFIRELPNKIDTIRYNLILSPDQYEQAKLQCALDLLHNIAGSAATFGFPLITTISRELEMALKKENIRSYFELAPLLELAADRLNAITEAAKFQRTITNDNPATAKTTVAPPMDQKIIVIIDHDAKRSHELAQQLSTFNYKVFESRDEKDLSYLLKLCSSFSACIVNLQDEVVDIKSCRGLQKIKASLKDSAPLIVLGSEESFLARLYAAKAGASEYLSRPHSLSMVIEAIDRHTEIGATPVIKVLIIDDQTDLVQFYASHMNQNGIITRIIQDPTHLDKVIFEFSPDLILMDVYMPDWNGPEIAQAIRQQPEFIDLPIILLAPEQKMNAHVSAVKLGADDLLTKLTPPDRLIQEIRSRVKRFRELRSVLHKDHLTGLLDHSAILKQLENEYFRTQRTGSPFVVAIIDIDNLKKVNENHGLAGGDQVIKTLGNLLRQRLRKTDHVGRYGGEEFMLILTSTTEEHALSTIDKIRTVFSEINFMSDVSQYSVTFSFGVTEFLSGSSLIELIAATDTSLKIAKSILPR